MSAIVSFELQNEPLFEMGQHLYMIGSCQTATFHEKCPVCEGTQKITVKGFEIPCGYCCGLNSPRSASEHLNISDLRVEEYIINRIGLVGEELKGEYKGGMYPPLRVSELYGFCKTPASIYRSPATQIHDFKYVHESELDVEITPENAAKYEARRLVYTSRAKALRAVEAFRDHQKDLLRQFNEVHGTSYEYPFET